MDQAEEDRIRHEIEDQVNKLLPGAVRRIEWHHHDDTPILEPGELMPSLVLTEPPGRRKGRPEPSATLKAFQQAHGPGLQQFQRELPQRWPQIRHIGIGFEDDTGRNRGGMIQALHDQAPPADPAGDDITHVMVRLKAADLNIVDTLITAGIANSRAEALRWALTRISQRPAYAQIREHTRDIERLKAEF